MSRRRAEQEFQALLQGARPSAGVVPLHIDGGPPTRRALMLRRAASNRSAGRELRPPVKRGTCDTCGGWGVLGEAKARCPICKGTGD